MAFDEQLAQRVRENLLKLSDFTEKKMMGGLCFLVDDKMLCGIHIDKKTSNNLLMARIGEERYSVAVEEPHVLPMDFTGRPMKGYVFIEEPGFQTDEALTKWLSHCLEFNPLAKSSKKKKK